MKRVARSVCRRPGLLVAAVVVAACTQAEPVSTELDEQAITAVANEWTAAYSDGDMDALLALYTEDAVDIPPGPISIGKAAIRQRHERGLVGLTANSSVIFDEVVVTGDWAFARGVYQATYTTVADGTQTQARNDNLWLFHRESDGSWRIARMMYNPAGEPNQP